MGYWLLATNTMKHKLLFMPALAASLPPPLWRGEETVKWTFDAPFTPRIVHRDKGPDQSDPWKLCERYHELRRRH